jgi:hypothetical protein
MPSTWIARTGNQPGWLRPGWCVIVLMILLTLVTVDRAGAAQRSPYEGFPLAKDVSGGGPFATLAEGRLPNLTRWGVWASRVGDGRLGYERPCLSLARITRFGEYADRHGCGTLSPTEERKTPVYISIAGSSQRKPGGPVVGETILALSFGPAVRSVVLGYADGGQLRRRTKLFNLRQQKKTKLPPFRYVAVAVQDDVCVATVVAHSQAGAKLLSIETGLCL